MFLDGTFKCCAYLIHKIFTIVSSNIIFLARISVLFNVNKFTFARILVTAIRRSIKTIYYYYGGYIKNPELREHLFGFYYQ